MIIGGRQFDTALRPIFLCLFNALSAGRNKIPPDESFSKRFATQKHHSCMFFCANRWFFIFIKHQHLTRMIIISRDFHTSFYDVKCSFSMFFGKTECAVFLNYCMQLDKEEFIFTSFFNPYAVPAIRRIQIPLSVYTGS